ncbi:pre-peptidase C-terminal domain-containing protein [Trichothermofontia sichuanensis B231]|uniref:pre-peptidase C-terminal domain-containing protein n=1 Tax=Trichothermofontia sichuanensis TaxID=3045816 RepID=UPI0022481E55|nr:pre-peptidase C-terminal domain-containing protein [Trichothermofontia sichuanensis]UZQ55583.1 pre-peptidase C-terminal domain-containing protein [Trichothermofontia sichuanensis B231]
MFDATAADSSASFSQSLDPTLQSAFVPGLAQVPEAALELAHTQLTNFFSEPDLLDVLRIPFGDFDEAQATALAQDFITGDFSNLLQIEILAAGVLQGANGGFDSLTGTIYLADNFLIHNADNPTAIANVLLEEIGHYIDAQINGVDSPGDEGEIFSAIVQGQSLTIEDLARLQAEDDTATIVVGDRSILIEKSDFAGNTLGTARNIGTLSGTQTFSDFVGSTDTNDFYRFNVASRSNFSLTLNGMSADADVQLIRDTNNNGIVDSGEVLASSTNGGTTADAISRTLDAGNYFVRVYPFGTANTNYTLSLTATPTTPLPTGSFNIQFDYRFDTNGFFSNPARRAALEAAADIWEAIIRDEFADVPAGTNLYVRNPQTDTMQYVTAGTIDDVLVFVGSRYIDGPFGTSADGGPSATYPSDSNLESRWNGSDFEPWTGSLSFDTGDSWFFDSTPTTANDIPFNTIDFISVAVHELGHVLGFADGINAFRGQMSGGYFNGPIARSVYGGPVPMQGSHISPTAGTHAMTPSGMAGTRTLPTSLDRAILDDIGYTVNYA